MSWSGSCFSHSLSFSGQRAGGKQIRVEKGDTYVISIGINDYKDPTGFRPLDLCVNDSDILVNKLRKDVMGDRTDSEYKVYAHKLNDSDATIANIRKAFKDVIANSKVNDFFVFNFSGYSWEIDNGDTILIPYDYESNLTDNRLEGSNAFSVIEMAKLMEQIKANRQLVISEAGSGRKFAQNLIGQLFEANPIIAAGTERQRVLITTTGMGIEEFECPDSTPLRSGRITHFISQHGNMLEVFHDIDKYEFKLMQSELACPRWDEKYVAIYNENDFREILISRFNEMSSRGSKGSSTEENKTENIERAGKIYALVVATNTYENQTDWNNLKNPVNDANTVAELLSDQYGVEIEKLYDQDGELVLTKIVELKRRLQPDDKLIVFFAGHGYHSDFFSDGFLVFKDSNPLQEDREMNSYLQMATLYRLLDNIPARANIYGL